MLKVKIPVYFFSLFFWVKSDRNEVLCDDDSKPG